VQEKQADGQRYNQEVKDLLDDGIIARTEKFTDLPIIHTGCDTYASIYPEFKTLTNLQKLKKLLNICYPLLQKASGQWITDKTST